MVTRILAALAAPVVLLILHDLLRRPTIRRLALRNVTRRKGEAALIVAGSLLGTAIVTASFIVGDTLRASVRDAARTQLGPIDEVVQVTGLPALPSVVAAVARGVPRSDGMLSAVTAQASLQRPSGSGSGSGADARAEPHVLLMEVDFDAARRFGGDPESTGLAGAGPTPRPGEIVIPADLASTLRAGKGDALRLFAYGTQRNVTVRDIVPKIGLAGFGQPSAFVAPGTINGLASPTAQGAGNVPPIGLVFVSNEGGVFDGAEITDEVRPAIEDRVGSLPDTEVQARKKDLLDRAEANARNFVALFGGIGAFSVTAGVLLLVNVFVMLADERKTQLGMLRAVGLKRNQLVRAFGAEGGIYSLLAGLAGALAGLGVGRIVAMVAERVFNAGEDERLRTALRFTARPSSLISGFVIGGVIALATVWIASVRIGRLNVIRAIRDLPEPPLSRNRSRALFVGSAGVVVGGSLFVAGLSSKSWFGTLVGVPLAAVAAVPLLSRVVGRKAATTWAGVVALTWALMCFTMFPTVFDGSNIPTFVVQGIILVAAAVGLGAANADTVGRLVSRVAGTRRSLAPRLAFAYPVARRFRTSMLLGIYALIIFVLTFLAIFSHLFDAQIPSFTRQSSAGFDLVLDSNPSDPATINTLFAQGVIETVAPIVRGTPRFASPAHPGLLAWPLSGFDRSFIERGHPALSDRADEFATDRDAWTAVLNGANSAFVASSFLQEGNGPPQNLVRVGDRITAHNPSTNDRRQLTVVGILSADFLDQGVVTSAAFAREFLGAGAVSNRHFVDLKDDQQPDVAARRLTGNLVQYGARADTIGTLVRLKLQEQQGFIRLMQGYLVLGLLVGVAGLGVVMVRAVRERRRHIGMLRALGFSRGVVRTAFLLEAGFVAVQGILVGLVLAVVVSFQLLTNSDLFGQARLDFSIPWLPLAVLVIVALVASLAATAAPAGQASRIRPAVALRIAE